MKRIRFSLRALLIVAAVLILFVGYSQKRRRDILETCRELKADGYHFSVSDTWQDYIWQRRPLVGTVVHTDGKVGVLEMWEIVQGARTTWLRATDQKELERLERDGFVEYEK